MFEDKTASKLKQCLIPTTLWGVEMSEDVTDQVVHKTVQSKQFALPLNENTDISNEVQLVALVSSSRNCGNMFYFIGSSREIQPEESFINFSSISIISSGSGVKSCVQVPQKR
jgi:hypothetical protein